MQKNDLKLMMLEVWYSTVYVSGKLAVILGIRLLEQVLEGKTFDPKASAG